MVIDAQVHVWKEETPDRPWEPGGRERALSLGMGGQFGPEELVQRMDAAGVDAAILVPPSFEGDRNDFCLEAAAHYPARFAVMGRIPLQEPSAALPIMERWCDNPGALGLRITFGADDSWQTDGTADWFWPEAERLRLPVMMYCAHGFDLGVVRRVAEQHGDLRLVIDHFGFPLAAKDAEALAALEGICGLADLPNVAVKASAAPSHTDEPYPFLTMQEGVRRAVQAFGAARVFWGSDLTRLRCSYSEASEFVRAECPFLDERERALMLGEGIAAWLGWRTGGA